MIQFAYSPRIGWLIGGMAFAAGLLLLSYFYAKGKSSRFIRSGLAALRWSIVGAVLLCLLDPQLVEAIKHQQKSRLAVLVDISRSMNVKDVPETRLGAAKRWLEGKLKPAMPGNVAVSFYGFHQQLAPLDSIDSAEPAGDGTGLGDALQALLAIPNDDPLVGVLICSDGIETLATNPEAVAKLYRRKGIPIHTVTVGTTNDLHDVIVENVYVKRAVPNESPTKITATVRSSGYAGRIAPIQIFRGSQLVAAQEVQLNGSVQRIEMDFTPRQKGFQTYELRVPPQEGEWLATNNRKLFGLEVIDPTIRVIYMEGTPQQPASSIPEWKYLKAALESDPSIKVKTLYRQFGAKGQLLNTVDADPETGEKIFPVEHPTQGFPRTLPQLLEYDVIIHSDIKTDSFTREQMLNMARLVEEFGGGFVMIGGNSAFGKGGYHRTILDRIIPVAMEQENDSLARPFQLRVPPAAFSHPIMALGATREATEMIWTKKFPKLYGCNLVDRAKPGAVTLADDPQSRNSYGPRLIMAVQNIGKGRSMAFTSDTTRSWGKDFETLWGERINPSLPLNEQNCDSRYYRQFWVNAVRWLAAGRIGRTNNPVTLELAQSACSPNEKVAVAIKVRDQELNEVNNAEVTVRMSSGGQTNAPYKAKFDQLSHSYRFDLSPGDAGAFVVHAVAKRGGRTIGEDRQLLVCEAGDREMQDLRAKPDLMAALSRISGGENLTATASAAPAVANIFRKAPPASVEYRRKPIWDRSWFLAAILGLLSTEWIVRRLSGMA